MYHKDEDIIKAFKFLEDAALAKENEIKEIHQANFSPLMMSLATSALAKINKPFSEIRNVLQNAPAMSKSLFTRWNEEFEANPLQFLSKVAMSSFGLGLILGRYFKESRENKNARKFDEQLV